MNQPIEDKGRIVQLDGLRGIAILLVTMHHYVANQFEEMDINSLNRIERVLMRVTSLGWCGVDLFFVLSGFLIGSILLKNRDSFSFFKTFYTRRFLRILPVYYLLLILFFILTKSNIYQSDTFIFENPLPLWYYFLFLQNYAMGIYKTFGPYGLSVSWSLAVEEQFYLIIPFVVYYINPKNYKFFIGIGLLTALVSRALLHNYYQDYTWLICRIDGPLVGFAIAVLMQNERFRTGVSKNFKWVLLAAVFLLLQTLVGHSLQKLGFINHTLSALDFGLVLLIVLFIKKGFFYRILTSPFLLLMGKISFFFYLFQQLINGLAHLIILHQKTPILDSLNSAMLTVVCFGVTVGGGVLSFRYLEGPLIRYSHKFKY